MEAFNFGPRLGRLTPTQLQQALDLFDLGQLQKAEPISFGLFGQNLMLTSDQGEFVLRGNPHYDWQFPTERYFVEQLHAHTQTPVPFPYHLAEEISVFGWPFVIMPKMAGIQLADPQVLKMLSVVDRHGIAQALGHNLAQMHTLTHPTSGRYDPTTKEVTPFASSYGDWVVDRVRTLLASSQKQNGHTTAEDAHWVHSILAESRSALGVPFTPTVVMEDYKEGNVVVEGAGEKWRVSGVFDFMTAHFGDPEADLSRQVGDYARQQPELAHTFVSAYLSLLPPREGFQERFTLYLLYDSLIIWEYLQRAEGGLPQDPALTLRSWAGPFISDALRGLE